MPTPKYTDWFPSPHCVRTIRIVLHTVSRLKRNCPLLSDYLRRAIALLRSVFHVGCGEHRAPQPNPNNHRTAAEFIQPLYNLLPADTQIVVLDTSAARNLAHTNTTPQWVDIFAMMSHNNYSFSLADNAFAELLSQIVSGAITSEEALIMKCRLETFLNMKLPILPGKMDISALIGVDKPIPDWSTDEVLELSSQSWSFLMNAGTTKVTNQVRTNVELQSEREAWINIFEKLGKCAETGEPLHEYKHTQLDNAFAHIDNTAPGLSPPLSTRADLQLRLLWRQYVRSKKHSKAYDPTSPKKKNDGVDFDLYYYLYLPALIVTTDEGFFKKLKDIDSFQKEWFWKPEDLAQAWSNGKQPWARWPEEATE